MSEKLTINEPETMSREQYQNYANRINLDDYEFDPEMAVDMMFALWDECQVQMAEVKRLSEMLRGEDD